MCGGPDAENGRLASREEPVSLKRRVLQSPEVRQGPGVDAAEASLLVGVGAGEVPSAGSGDALESNTRELYIKLAGGEVSLDEPGNSSGSVSVREESQLRRKRGSQHPFRGKPSPTLLANSSLRLPPSSNTAGVNLRVSNHQLEDHTLTIILKDHEEEALACLRHLQSVLRKTDSHVTVSFEGSSRKRVDKEQRTRPIGEGALIRAFPGNPVARRCLHTLCTFGLANRD
ncbi:hypothetical protein WN48_10783 [Eufriesea mexicana]|uniref:Uncharacterized protein n=1 Tax=Eufriesea mexicana TaxID=516756 RepID=A0A310S8U2_9HYME|nr:hypothetical protein WN48_10783 [Eufriesea mexicana]